MVRKTFIRLTCVPGLQVYPTGNSEHAFPRSEVAGIPCRTHKHGDKSEAGINSRPLQQRNSPAQSA